MTFRLGCSFYMNKMNRKPLNKSRLTRRRVIPLIGSSLLLPILGTASNEPNEKSMNPNEEYEILLRSDGTTVKVKRSAIRKSKLKKKNLSNSSLLRWLGKKF